MLLRRMKVEKLHIWGHTVDEIAKDIGVDVRTVSRDIQENRKERLRMISGVTGKSFKQGAQEWLRNELADYIGFMDESRRTFMEQSKTFKTEAARTRALWNAVLIANQKVETIKTMMFSVDDIATGSARITDEYDEEDDFEFPNPIR